MALLDGRALTGAELANPTGRPPAIPVGERPRVMVPTDDLLRAGHLLKNVPKLLKEQHGISVTLGTLKKYRTKYRQERQARGVD